MVCTNIMSTLLVFAQCCKTVINVESFFSGLFFQDTTTRGSVKTCQTQEFTNSCESNDKKVCAQSFIVFLVFFQVPSRRWAVGTRTMRRRRRARPSAPWYHRRTCRLATDPSLRPQTPHRRSTRRTPCPTPALTWIYKNPRSRRILTNPRPKHRRI